MVQQRNEKPKEVMKVGGDFSYLQEHLGGELDQSTEGMDEYRILPRIKIIQAMTDETMKDEHGEGSIIINPGSVLLAKKGEEFPFVPLFFFVEFCTWADRRDKKNSMIMARSFDKGSDIALKSRNAEERQEIYEGGPDNKPFKKRHVEHLNFAGVIYGEHDQTGTTCVLSFSRGEYSKGRGFISAIKMRRIGTAQAPLWSQVWLLRQGFRDRGENKWHGIDFSIPQVPFIRQEDVAGFKQLHEILKKDFEAKKIVVNRLDEDADADAVETDPTIATETRY